MKCHLAAQQCRLWSRDFVFSAILIESNFLRKDIWPMLVPKQRHITNFNGVDTKFKACWKLAASQIVPGKLLVWFYHMWPKISHDFTWSFYQIPRKFTHLACENDEYTPKMKFYCKIGLWLHIIYDMSHYSVCTWSRNRPFHVCDTRWTIKMWMTIHESSNGVMSP